MTNEKLYELLGDINENHVKEAREYRKAKKPGWMKWGAMAACLCLMLIAAIPVVNFFTDYQADDPNWEKTHYETSVLSEIEAVCGTDLLIDKVAQADKGFRNYHLEIVENGSFENKSDWKDLTIEVNSGNGPVDSAGDRVLCFISFDGNTDGTYIEDYLTETATMEINGHTVEYREASLEELAAENINYGHKQEYHGWAKFTHNGYEYYITTDSDNPDFFKMTLEQLLKAENNDTPNIPNALVPAVMYDGEIYCTTGKQIPVEVDESAIVGEVTSVVPLSQWPNEEGQANFGEEGMSLAVTSSGFLVLVENEWTLFEPQEAE